MRDDDGLFLYVCETSEIEAWASSKVYIGQFQQLYTCVTGRFTDRNDDNEVYKYHERVMIPRLSLRAPNIDGKQLVSVDHPDFDMAYDTGVFPAERHRVQLAGCYLLMSYTGARPAELVDDQRTKPKGGPLDEILRMKAITSAGGSDADDKDKSDEADDEVPPDEDSKQLNELLSAETTVCGCSKALCYKDILMIIVRHPRTGRLIPVMAVNFIHHKGCDKKPRPTIFYFTLTKKLILCTVSIVTALALYDQAFAVESLTDAVRVLGVKT
ncbi:hypothetical protein DL767_006363 [Monosporascus sp. MG133]|nr:hypothetical protein DL767_006363 [Monosporascus sp. MG133]